jgi:hypothetical protein
VKDLSNQIIIKCRNCKTETEDLEKGLCEGCRETETLHESIAKKIKTHIQDQTTEKALLKSIDELTELAKESEWRQCKALIVDTMLNEKLHQQTAWRLFVVLQNIHGQAQHLESWEKDLVPLLRNTMRYSLSTIALVLGRSKETVSRHAKEGDI